MPVAKRPQDRDALRSAIFWDEECRKKIMLGTDSAPHSEHNKLHCGCAGVFTAPIALQLLAMLFTEAAALETLQGFVSGNARDIYGIDLPKKVVTLERKPFVIPSEYEGVVPMWAGRELPWSIKKIS